MCSVALGWDSLADLEVFYKVIIIFTCRSNLLILTEGKVEVVYIKH